MGPLHGTRVIEMAGIGPAPFCGMMLGDLGAEVIRIERSAGGEGESAPQDPLLRNRRSVALNLKSPAAIEAVLRLLEGADVLIEGFRPGVMERLGLGPQTCLARNPRLVYGRMTGWGQDGPLAASAGHDIDYIALTGALHLIGTPEGKPVVPLNLIGDFGGGGMLLFAGVLAALLESTRSGAGQVVDAAMVDGTLALMAMYFGFRGQGLLQDRTGGEFLGGAAPYYDTYPTADGHYLAVGAIEPQFFQELLAVLGLDRERFGRSGFPHGPRDWPALREAIGGAIRSRTRAEWEAAFAGRDACVAPVLSVAEALRHPHNLARGNVVEVAGLAQNAPAPRFGRSVAAPPQPPRVPGADTQAVLREAGYDAAALEALRAAGAWG